MNIASNSGIQGLPYATAYGMSKGGVLQLTKSLAVEYIKTPIRVNAIAPAGCKAPSITGAVYTIVNGMTVS